MSGYCINPQEYCYGMQQCPYRESFPMRTQFPVYPHQQESNQQMHEGYYGNMGMGYYEQSNPGVMENMYGNINPWITVCPYQNINPQMSVCPYQNTNPQMSGCPYQNIRAFVPYQAASDEQYGYDNLYPKTDYKFDMGKTENYTEGMIKPQYNEYGYINPDENTNSPWDNNQMYGKMGTNPLPE